MGQWYCTWGYESLDFSTFPIQLEEHVQEFIFLNMLDGDGMRLRFQNKYNDRELVFLSVKLFECSEQGEKQYTVTCKNKRSFGVGAGQSCFSDKIDIHCESGKKYKIQTVFAPKTVISTACSFLENNIYEVQHYDISKIETQKSDCLECEFSKLQPAQKLVFGIDRIQVYTEKNVKVIAAFGDSITHMSRWTAPLAERVLACYPGEAVVMNAGICGNRLLHDAAKGSGLGNWFGQKGIERFEGDLYKNDYFADYVIILMGINDIIHPDFGVTSLDERVTSMDIIDGLNYCIDIAHHNHSKVLGCTILPFKDMGMKRTSQYDRIEVVREEVNKWIRNSAGYDDVIDFDLCVRDKKRPEYLDPCGESEDGLHPGIKGGNQMADFIDLELFS